MEKVKLDSLPDALSPREVASVLGVSYGKALHLIKHGNIVHIRAGNHYIVAKSQFISWLNAGKTRIIDTE